MGGDHSGDSGVLSPLEVGTGQQALSIVPTEKQVVVQGIAPFGWEGLASHRWIGGDHGGDLGALSLLEVGIGWQALGIAPTEKWRYCGRHRWVVGTGHHACGTLMRQGRCGHQRGIVGVAPVRRWEGCYGGCKAAWVQ